ncbi:NADH:ubiquinone reductase (Na(+)-transporting) subunit D [Saprospira grandis]|uniref:Na(+)-translocating NADH-quinone reductase subunit D n=2 Tax=Saprospira grandis TaxID=1008 RepID=H6KZK0_SAPGL|nr:NADH:ubiquinone reductase (Na(+)-transporting) subunit D [Saprospira grandis]AFC25776.1 Na(+)-translocating NADH-quinone reductase subunit D [Saprospira grandis str. Lewin]EJF52358.1 NADH:ubiquinone oxidoreductase, Na(+)-translocating, D subunit [Saprospira grandis DSM 2844]WBM73748.1 NADH:ubiquinone reductase (Na(+)-transporting) subunit D [Saprospira grandis]
MAQDTQQLAEAEKKEPAFGFGKEERQLLTDPLNDNNPITVQVLGICSALAVTSQVYPSLIMAVALIFVTSFSNLIISMLRNSIPGSIRMIVQLLVIAGLVQVVEIVLGAFAYSAYESLAVFIGLIITNCIVMGRLEAFAMANKPWRSFLDGLGNGIGYGVVLVAMAIVRELFGKGSFMGWKVMPDAYIANNLMVLPAASLFIIGIFIWIQRSLNPKLVDVS